MKNGRVVDYLRFIKPGRNFSGIDREIMRHRSDLSGNRIWILLRIAAGTATEADIEEFNRGVVDYKKMRNRFNKMRKSSYKLVASRDGEFCAKCGSVEKLTVDHITPLSRGGDNSLENLQILCLVCNSKKGAR